MSKRYPGGIIRKTPQTPSQTSAQGVWDMASVTQAVKENTWPIAGVPDPISRSLRFRSSASANLTRTPSTSGNRKTWTWSAWIKRGALTQTGTIWGSNFSAGGFGLAFGNYGGAGVNPEYIGATLYAVGTVTTAAVFRDPSAWYHIVVAFDSTQATQSNRFKLYVNNVQQTMSGTLNVTLNADYNVNLAGALHVIGGESTYYNDMYMTEVYLIDGQALTPSSFGNTNDQTGVWQPIAYTGTYGTNGFYLPFSNTASTATLGYDYSGNSNNWTTNNISLTSGTTYDSMVDVPTQWIPYNTAGDTGALFRGNYCVLNPLQGTGITGSFYLDSANLNLNVTNNSGYRNLGATFSPEGFKGYLEVTMVTSPNMQIGFAYESITPSNLQYTSAGTFYIDLSGDVKNGSTTIKSGCTPAFSSGDILQIAFDFTSGARNVWFGLNGTWGSNSVGVGVPSTGTNPVLTVSNIAQAARFYFAVNTGGGTVTIATNFGQRPFSYTPPTGFKTLCTTNLSTPTIGATASSQANKYMDATLYTGNGSTQTITNAGGFQPDLVWYKGRSTAYNHRLFDVIRGVTKDLQSNSTDAEGTISGLTAFNSNGFSLGSEVGGNNNGTTYVAWQWRASNATAVTNTAGSITSTVSANTTAGFSIVTWTGNGSTSTVGHGLGVAPSMIIVKRRDAGGSGWSVYFTTLAAGNVLSLQSTNAASSSPNRFTTTLPTSTVFSIGTDSDLNASGGTYVAYCFAQVAGYSAFGSYVGNGNADGPFIYTGFRPRYYILKNITNAQSWSVQDTARSPYNVGSAVLFPNISSAESTGTDFVDILSNGFKIRHSSSGNNNNNGDTYIYMAFAESPFKFSLAR